MIGAIVFLFIICIILIGAVSECQDDINELKRRIRRLEDK